jgi:hypothetical protein
MPKGREARLLSAAPSHAERSGAEAMTDILSHIRNAASACTETYEVAMTINEARQLVAMIDGQQKRITELEAQLAETNPSTEENAA